MSSALGNPGKEHERKDFQKELSPEMNSRKSWNASEILTERSCSISLLSELLISESSYKTVKMINDVLIYKPAGQGTNLVAGQYIYICYVVCDFNPWKLIVHMF